MKKKILLISPVSLFPTIMASQDRIIKLAKTLSLLHIVDVIMPYSTDEEKELSYREFDGLSGNIYFIKYPNSSFLKKKIYGGLKLVLNLFIPIISERYYPTWPSVIRKTIRIIDNSNYDVIHLEYWYQGKIFKKIKNPALKVIDTHNVLFEKRALEMNRLSDSKWDRKSVNKYKKLELDSYSYSDLLISISNIDFKYFNNQFPNKEHIIIPTGQELEGFLKYNIEDGKDNIVLFYGSMIGEQNIHAFWRLYNHIFPEIKKEITNLKLMVVGANPPQEIKKLDNNQDIIVTGYVVNLGEYLSKAKIMILPLEISGGFRSRVIEVMSLGIPIIGTHNALDNVGATNGKELFIYDMNEEIIRKAIEILHNDDKLVETGKKARQFCIENYSIESTYQKLSEYYESI